MIHASPYPSSKKKKKNKCICLDLSFPAVKFHIETVPLEKAFKTRVILTTLARAIQCEIGY